VDRKKLKGIKMAKVKRKLSKTAKAALKILEESKLLAATKTSSALKADQAFKPNEAAIKTSGANKARPDKKRG
jgi:hypothetical protein